MQISTISWTAKTSTVEQNRLVSCGCQTGRLRLRPQNTTVPSSEETLVAEYRRRASAARGVAARTSWHTLAGVKTAAPNRLGDLQNAARGEFGSAAPIAQRISWPRRHGCWAGVGRLIWCGDESRGENWGPWDPHVPWSTQSWDSSN
jgi:hypothetical protein